MEQKILSLKDDKINSEVELYEYPVELRGGRNLLLKSDVEQSYDFEPIGGSGITPIKINAYRLTSLLIPYEYYTISMLISGSGNLRPHILGSTQLANFNIANDEPKWFYNKIASNYYLDKNIYLYTNRDTGFSGTIHKIKIEKGNIPTDWTPAPEDLGLSYPDHITEFKPSISDRYILTEELIEYPEELRGGRNCIFSIQRHIKDVGFGYAYLEPNTKYILMGHKGLVETMPIKFNLQIRIAPGTVINSDRIIDYGWTNSFPATFTTPETLTSGIRYVVQLWNSSVDSIIELTPFLKLEKGTIPTDWTPAPEDLGLSYPDNIQSFGTSFGNNILINEFIEQGRIESIQDGYWVHKDTGVKTYFGADAPFINNGVMSRPDWLFDAIEIKLCSGINDFELTEIEIGGGTMYICLVFIDLNPETGEGGNDVLQSIDMSNTLVNTVESFTFFNCPSLTSINLSEGLTSIGINTFFKCTSLTSITLPEGLTSIGDRAFMSCTSLSLVTSLPTIPPSLGSSAFDVTHENFIIKVPAQSVNAYKTATYWNNYAVIISVI